MAMKSRPVPYTLPSYSLTGDLLGYLRCGLQYRYTRIGKLPPTRPVQLWFGQFIHGVLDEGWRRYVQAKADKKPWKWPLEQEICDEIVTLIMKRLAAQGLFPRQEALETLAKQRANACLQELAPHLYPLIAYTEVRLTGTEELPPLPAGKAYRNSDRYEMLGVVDVVTEVAIDDPSLKSNPILQAIQAHLPATTPKRFQVIIDYKGSRRPPINPKKKPASGLPTLWSQYEWQLQTYASLRQKQADSAAAGPVVAGVLIYVNEILPTADDLKEMIKEMKAGESDLPPMEGISLEEILKRHQAKAAAAGKADAKAMRPDVPFEFRLNRALRVVPICPKTIDDARREFTEVVKKIEYSRGSEYHGSVIADAWAQNADDESTCAACDFRTYCPTLLKDLRISAKEKKPQLPYRIH